MGIERCEKPAFAGLTKQVDFAARGLFCSNGRVNVKPDGRVVLAIGENGHAVPAGKTVLSVKDIAAVGELYLALVDNTEPGLVGVVARDEPLHAGLVDTAAFGTRQGAG